MKKRIVRYLKHIGMTLLILLGIAVSVLVYLNGSIKYGDNPLQYHLDHEGPYVFYENDSMVRVNYIRGDKQNGFYLDTKKEHIGNDTRVRCFFPLDSTTFDFTLQSNFSTPKALYDDGNKVLAISDIESGYKTFRDFLMANGVIDKNLRWTFGQGHLVLLGDFVDRGYSTTQVLWFIYKLEQDAQKHGGYVHFILGNHELYNMQGQYKSAEHKYYAVASILGTPQHGLYGKDSFLGRWMSSKNTMERINGTLFVHGGVHPEIAEHNLTLHDINRINRAHYYTPYFPKPGTEADQLVLSNKKGICWYRGYFDDTLSSADIQKGLNHLGAESVVVGHTLQSKVKKLYGGKIYAIDVVHPKDYMNMWPHRKSEGLLIQESLYYRVLHNGKRKRL